MSYNPIIFRWKVRGHPENQSRLSTSMCVPFGTLTAELFDIQTQNCICSWRQSIMAKGLFALQPLINNERQKGQISRSTFSYGEQEVCQCCGSFNVKYAGCGLPF